MVSRPWMTEIMPSSGTLPGHPVHQQSARLGAMLTPACRTPGERNHRSAPRSPRAPVTPAVPGCRAAAIAAENRSPGFRPSGPRRCRAASTPVRPHRRFQSDRRWKQFVTAPAPRVARPTSRSGFVSTGQASGVARGFEVPAAVHQKNKYDLHASAAVPFTFLALA